LIATHNLRFKDMLSYQDLTILKSSVTFITGESGCGKSTLLKLLNGITRPSQGKVLYKNKDILEYNPIKLRQELLLVSQSAFLFDISIKENFINYYKYRELTPISESNMQHFLEICQIDMPLDSICTNLSGGERQRVFCAINISYKPSVLMLDEPTSALDEKTSKLFLQSIISFCKNSDISLIIVSHSKELAKIFAENIIKIGDINE